MRTQNLIPKEVPSTLIYIWIFTIAVTIGVILGNSEKPSRKSNYDVTLTNINTQKTTRFNNVNVSIKHNPNATIEVTTKAEKHYYYPKAQFIVKTNKELR